MKNLKDTITVIAGILIAFGGLIYTLSISGIAMPEQLVTAGIIAATVGGAIVSYFSGKNADGTTKTTEQISAQKPPPVPSELEKPPSISTPPDMDSAHEPDIKPTKEII